MVIAEAAGGSWPRRARPAAVCLSAESEITVTAGIRLLENIREAFDGSGAAYLSTGVLLGKLYEFDDAPWGDWFGRQLTPHALAKLLSPFRITSRQQRLEGKKFRGYWAVDFQDAWARYLPLPFPVTGTSGTSGSSGTGVPDVPDVPVSREGRQPDEPLPGWVTDPDPEA